MELAVDGGELKSGRGHGGWSRGGAKEETVGKGAVGVQMGQAATEQTASKVEIKRKK